MAIEIVVGNVGSGKTYYATWRIWQEIKKIYEADIKGVPYRYKRILTNIEGIKENKYVKHLKVDELVKLWEEEVKIYEKWEQSNAQIDFSKITFTNPEIEKDIEYLKLKELYERYIDHSERIREYKSYNDKILEEIKIPDDRETAYINFVKPHFAKLGYTDCLIVIDEAHNYFRTLGKAKERLVSYHRHYDQDYLLITQDPSQLARKVTAIAQKTIKAVNPVMKATKSFNYKVYSGGYISYRDTNLLEKIRLKADPDIFRLYHSGSSKTQKSYLIKVLAKPLGLIAVVVLGIIYFLTTLDQKAEPIKPKTEQTKIVSKKEIEEDKEAEKPVYADIQALKVGNFIIYKGKKYYYLDFRKAIIKCKALSSGIQKNLDSTIVLYYKIKDPKCLDTLLSSASSF